VGEIHASPIADGQVANERRQRRAEQAALLRLYEQTGDPEIRERLVELHLPLVRALARRYVNRGEGLEDLVQVGSIGLLEAIDRFNSDRGSDLVSFAIPTITGEIKRHLRDRSTVVRLPRRLAECARAVRPAQEVLAARLHRQPTVSELAVETGLGEDDVADAIGTERARLPVCLSISSVGGVEADEAMQVEGTYEASEERMLLAAGFRTLGARERRILHLRFFAGLSQSEIAGEVGLSQIQVSRLIRSSLERMRGALEVSTVAAGDTRVAR
jgi:RNA polymerase sigma-B factor